LKPSSVSPGTSSTLHNEMPRNRTYRFSVLAFLGGLSLFLSTIEYVFPKPVPFFRLGLANIPILLALGVLSPGELFLLGLLKILGQGLVNGTLASYVFLFSLGGTAASMLAMYGYYRLFSKHTSYLGISLIGALASNLVQVWLSLQFIFGRSAWIIVPYFLGMGGATGMVMGIFATLFVQRSQWFHDWLDSLGGPRYPGLPGGIKTIGPGSPHSDQNLLATDESQIKDSAIPKRVSRSVVRDWRNKRKLWIQEHGDPRVLFLGGLSLLVLYALQSNLLIRAVQVVLVYFLVLLTGKKIRLGYFLILVGSISLFSLLQPAGAVLLRIGTFAITRGALEQGLFRGLTLVGFVFLSLAMVQPHLQLPGKAGFLLAKTFQYYESFNHFRGEIGAKGFIQKITVLLYRVFPPQSVLSQGIDSQVVEPQGKEPLIYPKTDWKIWIVMMLLAVGFFLSLQL